MLKQINIFTEIFTLPNILLNYKLYKQFIFCFVLVLLYCHFEF